MRRPAVQHLMVFVGLMLAVTLLFWQVLDTGFWSPEDLRELGEVAAAEARGELRSSLRPTFAGGYPSNPVFALEYHLFGMNPRPYFAVNMIFHLLNSFLAYTLVATLFHSRRAAFLAALLFALAVGSYGKNLMYATGISSLVYSMLVLLGTLLYVLNEKRNAGRAVGLYAAGFYTLFIASLFMRGGTFSLLASFAFYNLFFRQERQRPVLHTNLIVCIALATGSMLQQVVSGRSGSPDVDAAAFLVNLPGYLILMVFPLHQSELLSTAPPLVRAVYAIAPTIRILVGLSILSYSLFGLVFGGRALRFYIAWMYVMIVPFAFFRYPADWLNLRFLYLVSVGFCVLLVIGTLYAFRLLSKHRVRRFVPFAIPAFYIVLSMALVRQLDQKNEQLARSPATLERLRAVAGASRTEHPAASTR